MSTLRVKLMVLPHEERLCVLANSNSTIADLRNKVFHAIQFYSIYKEYLSFCSIHLEIKIDDASYAVPDHYLLADVVKPNDVFIVTFIDNQQYQNRQSIQMNHTTAADIHHRSKQQFAPKQPRHLRPEINKNINIQSPQSMKQRHPPIQHKNVCFASFILQHHTQSST